MPYAFSKAWTVRGFRLSAALVLAALASCESDRDSGEGGSDERGGNSGSGGTTISDRCAECTSSSNCESGFCNRVAIDDLSELVAGSTPARGRCSLPADTGTCACVTGVLTGDSLCIGTGCPPGERVRLCDHLSGEPFVGSGNGGTGGSASTGGSAGKGGTSGAGGSGAPALGAPCTSSGSCEAPLTCLTSDGESGVGPAGGLCTTPCTNDATCRAIAAGAYCANFGAPGSYCVAACVPGSLGLPKCSERSDVACSLLGLIPSTRSCTANSQCSGGELCAVDGVCGDIVTACLPTCGGDFDCGSGRYCDFSVGLCTDARPPGLPIGSVCTPAENLDDDPCSGFCLVDDGESQGVCSALCTFNPDFRGCGWNGTGAAQAACLFATVLEDNPVNGDLGICGPLCDCNDDCVLPSHRCVDDTGGLVSDIFGRDGYCRALLPSETERDSIACSGGSGGAGGMGGLGGEGGL